ncbi:MAG: hypothetical protein ACK44D_10745 [Bacteroidia bacterium]
MASIFKHINAVFLVALALVYLMPNFTAVTLAVADCVEQTCNDSFAKEVEEKDCKDTEIYVIPEHSIDELLSQRVTLDYILNQVPIKPVIKQLTPPPQA